MVLPPAVGATSGGPVDPLFTRFEVAPDLDAATFTAAATSAGWGDGLPLLVPHQELVREYVAAADAPAEDVVTILPPRFAPCTVRDVARNAVMTAAPAAAMPLLCTALRAMTARDFDLMGLSATTEAAVPALVVNGDIRLRVDVPSGAGCFGGAVGAGPAIGRALRLVLRNIGGHAEGVSSWSVHGQPGRVTGIVVAEAEDRSPWAPLAARRGVHGDAVTVFAAQGTIDIVDAGASAAGVLAAIGGSLAVPATPPFMTAFSRPEVLVAICPAWAELLAAEVGSIEEVSRRCWDHAVLPVSMWTDERRARLEEHGRVDDKGMVHVVALPEDLLLVVCGGPGGLYATALHGWGATRAITLAIPGTSPGGSADGYRRG